MINSSVTILIVSDDILVTSPLEDCLTGEGFGVLIDRSGSAALEILQLQQPDLIVLDVGLPKEDGMELCQQIRQESTIPLIILTGRDRESDCILGLELGADTCLPKTVSGRELVARIKAVFRRIALARVRQANYIQIGQVRLDTGAYKVYKRDQALPLRQKEYDLLHTLMSRAGEVISRAELIDKVWGIEWLGDTRTLDVHIRWVREKIEEIPSRPRYIQTIRGVGYRFAAPAELISV